MADFQRVQEDAHKHWRFLLPHELQEQQEQQINHHSTEEEEDEEEDDDYWNEYPELKSQEEIEQEEREQKLAEQKIKDCIAVKGKLMQLYSSRGAGITGREFVQLAYEVAEEMEEEGAGDKGEMMREGGACRYFGEGKEEGGGVFEDLLGRGKIGRLGGGGEEEDKRRSSQMTF
eukprot:Nk52_evm1s1259 gene=Nk52_evmTU1s1259